MARLLSQLLQNQTFCLLTTYRRDGTPVATPMWFALQGETVLLATKGRSGKVRRLRANPQVTIGPCNGSGHPRGPQWEAQGEILEDPAAHQEVEALLLARYGLKRRLLRWALRFATDPTDAYLAIRLTEAPAPSVEQVDQLT